jgi:hypothetical protein
MTSFRDDAPANFSLYRRKILVGGALLLGEVARANYVSAALPDGAGNDASTPFMEISQLLIQHRLDRDVGRRLAIAMAATNPAFSEQITELLVIAKGKNAKIVEDFFPDIPAGPLKECALAIISAWYMGVIVDAAGAEVFAFELALMYQPTIDVMTIPTYAISGPNGWTSDAPPLNAMPTF